MKEDNREVTNGQEFNVLYTYAIDTDEVRTGVPEEPRTANDEEGYSRSSMEPEYESPLPSTKPRPPSRNNACTRKGSDKSCTRGSRCKENVIYNTDRYHGIELNDRRYTGYFLPNTNLDSPEDVFSYDNPLRDLTSDENIYAKPSPEFDGRKKESRARENSVYESIENTAEWKTRSATTELNLEGIRDIHGGKTRREFGVEKPKRARNWTTWLIVILSCAAFVLACLAFLKSNQALSGKFLCTSCVKFS